jgi:hypothetical protein
MTVVSLSFESIDFKKIVETTSTIRSVGNVAGLGGIALAYYTMYKDPSNPDCAGSMST